MMTSRLTAQCNQQNQQLEALAGANAALQQLLRQALDEAEGSMRAREQQLEHLRAQVQSLRERDQAAAQQHQQVKEQLRAAQAQLVHVVEQQQQEPGGDASALAAARHQLAVLQDELSTLRQEREQVAQQPDKQRAAAASAVAELQQQYEMAAAAAAADADRLRAELARAESLVVQLQDQVALLRAEVRNGNLKSEQNAAEAGHLQQQLQQREQELQAVQGEALVVGWWWWWGGMPPVNCAWRAATFSPLIALVLSRALPPYHATAQATWCRLHPCRGCWLLVTRCVTTCSRSSARHRRSWSS